MPKIYGVGRTGRIHRDRQPEYVPTEEARIRKGRPVTIFDAMANETIEFPSSADAAYAIGCSMQTVEKRCRGHFSDSLLHGRYVCSWKEDE